MYARCVRGALLVGLFLFFASFALTKASYGAEKFKIAINDLEPIGVSETLALSTSELLRTELFKTGYYHVMERRQMKSILKEQAFQLSGATEQDIVEIGKLLSVHLMAMGSINRIGRGLLINIRLVDVEKARVNAAETVSTFDEDKIPEAVVELARKISRTIPLRGKVIGLQGMNEVIVSLGSQDRMQKGMGLRVQRLGKEFKDPGTGKVLGRAVIEVALLRVHRVMNESISSALILENYAEVQVGDIVGIWTGSPEDLPNKRPAEEEKSGKVIELEGGNEVIVSRGRLDELRKGMILRIQRFGKEFKDPSTGKVLGRAVTEVALVRVDRVINESISRASVLENYAEVQVGDIVGIWTGSPEKLLKKGEKKEKEIKSSVTSMPATEGIARPAKKKSDRKKKWVIPPISF